MASNILLLASKICFLISQWLVPVVGAGMNCRTLINSDREYEIHNILDRMEDLRQDILNDKLYDSDTDHDGYDWWSEDEDTVFSKLHALSSRDRSETFFEMFCYLTNKGFGILQNIKLLTLSVKNKPEIKHT